MAEPATEAAGDGIVTRAMLFWLGGRCWAISADLVVRVMAPPPVSRLPLLPSGISGVVALGGKVVPVLDLHNMLDLAAADQQDGELVLIAIGAASYALYVDRVVQIAAGIWTDASQWRGTPVHCIDIGALLEQCLTNSAAACLASVGSNRDIAPTSAAAIHHGTVGDAPRAAPTNALTVETAISRHLLPLDAVLDISEALVIAAVPDPTLLFAGAAFYRDALLPVIPLDTLLGRPNSEAGVWGAFVIVDVDGWRCVLAVKRVIGLSFEAAPDRLVDLRSLLANLLPRTEAEPAARMPQQAAQAAAVETRHLLVELAGRTCAFALMSVAHIHPASPMVQAPAMARSSIAGVTAIAGRVLPVFNLAGLLGLTGKSTMAHFVELKSEQSGAFVVAVDAVSGIAAIAPDSLLRPPEGGTISAVAQLGAAFVWILTASLIAERGGWRSDVA